MIDLRSNDVRSPNGSRRGAVHLSASGLAVLVLGVSISGGAIAVHHGGLGEVLSDELHRASAPPPPSSSESEAHFDPSEPLVELEHSAGLAVVYSAHFDRKARWNNGERTVEIMTREMDPLTEEWFEYYEHHSVSFDISTVRTQLGDELIVVGHARNGDLVMEHWVIPAWPGGWEVVATMPPPGAGISNPVTDFASSVGVAGGGPWVPPAERISRPTLERQEIYRGDSLGQVKWVELDPLGRFVHILSSDPAVIWIIDLGSEEALPKQVWDTDDFAFIASADSIVSRQHEDYGRVFYLLHSETEPTSDEFLESLLFDQDDDGYFETSVTLPQDQFSLAFPALGFDYSESVWWWVD